MWLIVHKYRAFFSFSGIKKAEPFITYFQSEAPPSTLQTNKYK